MDKSELLGGLYQARLDDLKALAHEHNLSKAGSVEALRSRLIQNIVLGHWDLSKDGIKEIPNSELGELLGVLALRSQVQSKHDASACISTFITTPSNSLQITWT